MIGIYMITNKINGKVYIGQSVNILSRWREHINNCYELKDNSVIHRALRKYGIENFTFEVLHLCKKEELNDAEKYYIEQYNSFGKGYNLTVGGDGAGHLNENNPNSKMTKKDIIDIRTKYANHIAKIDVYKPYSNKISFNTFQDIWVGKTWKNIMPEVYTKENKEFHKNNFDRDVSSSKRSVFTLKDIVFIKDCRKDGLSRKEVYDTYFKNINFNTFSSIWYNQAYKRLQSTHPQQKTKRRRLDRQDGCFNPCARFTPKEVLLIRERKNNGESLKTVYQDYANVVNIDAFRNLWNNKTYKNF